MGGSDEAIVASIEISLARAERSTTAIAARTTAAGSTISCEIRSFPALMRPMSSTSSTIRASALAFLSIDASALSSASPCRRRVRAMVTQPRIGVSGVLSSWLRFARNTSLVRSASCALSSASRSRRISARVSLICRRDVSEDVAASRARRVVAPIVVARVRASSRRIRARRVLFSRAAISSALDRISSTAAQRRRIVPALARGAGAAMTSSASRLHDL